MRYPRPIIGMLALLAMLHGIQALGDDWEESAEVAVRFKHAGVDGTFVLYDVEAGRMTGHDRSRANTRFVPASTFKIPNTLIGLSTGAVRSVDEILPYGGQPQPFKAWERDMGLRDAIVLSNVPIYQALARRIGLERMREAVSRLKYGNAEIGSVVDRFWLDGPLRISAVEQARFLAGLAGGGLPVAAGVQDSTREILKIEQGADWTLYGKTGWENAPGEGVGWWVGWVERGERIHAFALNMDMRNPDDAGKRQELGRASLVALGVL